MRTCAWHECTQQFGGPPRQKFCTEAHARADNAERYKQKTKAARRAAAGVEARVCAGAEGQACSVSIEEYSLRAERCYDCKAQHDKARHAANYMERAARTVASRRARPPMPERVCVGCGDAYRPTRSDQSRCQKDCNGGRRATFEAKRKRIKSGGVTAIAADGASWREAVALGGPKPPSGVRPDANGNWFPGWDGHYPPSFTALERRLLDAGRGRILTLAAADERHVRPRTEVA